MQKRLIITFFMLLLITGAGVLAAVFLPKDDEKAETGKKDAIEASAKPADKKKDSTQVDQHEETKKEQPQEENSSDMRTAVLSEAELLAAGYDYDAAIETLKSFQGYEDDSEMTARVADYETKKASCVPVNINEVTHVFYHSLVVDPELCFANQETDRQAVGNNQWMTTIDEFNKITQEMYDRGYVLVDLHDLVEETTDDSGNVHFKEGTIMLPPD